MEYCSSNEQLKQLKRELEYLFNYLKIKESLSMTQSTQGTKIFIGHGRSSAWKDLRDFLKDRLSLEPDEFNREPTAGVATKERLEQMIADASFAFIIMTAEDIHSDDKLHARENVIHEIGLFQGKLGFKKAVFCLKKVVKNFQT